MPSIFLLIPLLLQAQNLMAGDTWQEHNRLGEKAFQAGEIADSIREFDRAIALEPRLAPHHWQRGISLYYAGRFDDCAAQFALHKTVNPEDVENAVWHYLCVARVSGVGKARSGLIPIHNDGRVPMMQIYEMFQGRLKPEEVLKVAQSPDALFYAHLYIGLWFEASGNRKAALDHVRQAAAGPAEHYMHDVARVHLLVTK
jgi:lipoprotein NlpI